MLNDYLAQANALRQADQPFVLATVVRAHAPTSAKAGAKAIITANGNLTGWVGGSCTQPTVIRESLKALSDGSPRFLRLGPPEELHGASPGIIEVPLMCISGGTLEIYLDPHLPLPRLMLIGHLPVVEALVEIGKAMNYTVMVIGEEVTPNQFPHADQTLPLDIASLPISSQTFVVVASHGNYDEPALEKVLNSPAPYVALVASRKRGEAVHEYLRGSGLSEEQLARLKCPAGLDFGAVTPEEIALSIMAEIVQLRRRGSLSTQHSTLNNLTAKAQAPDILVTLPQSILDMRPNVIPTPGPGEALDPVCHMNVEIATARYKTDYNGQTYYFCAPGCKRSFEKNPQQFLV
jgi:xanthine dehydrogenase accessory factor